MSSVPQIRFSAFDPKQLSDLNGHLAVLVTPEGVLDQAARTANRLTKGALARLIDAESFKKVKSGQVITLAWPAGLAVEALHVLVLSRKLTVVEARKAGAKLIAAAMGKELTVMAGSMRVPRSYRLSPRSATLPALTCTSIVARASASSSTSIVASPAETSCVTA